MVIDVGCVRRSGDQSIVPLLQCQISLFFACESVEQGEVSRGRGAGSVLRGGGAANVCNLFGAILCCCCCGCCCLPGAARLCNYWQSLSCSFRAAGGHLATRIDAAPCLLPYLPQLGTWALGSLSSKEKGNYIKVSN